MASADEKEVIDTRYHNWKRNVQYTYDVLANSNAMWPSLSLCWGPRIDGSTAHVKKQLLYTSARTGAARLGCPLTAVARVASRLLLSALSPYGGLASVQMCLFQTVFWLLLKRTPCRGLSSLIFHPTPAPNQALPVR